MGFFLSLLTMIAAQLPIVHHSQYRTRTYLLPSTDKNKVILLHNPMRFYFINSTELRSLLTPFPTSAFVETGSAHAALDRASKLCSLPDYCHGVLPSLSYSGTRLEHAHTTTSVIRVREAAFVFKRPSPSGNNVGRFWYHFIKMVFRLLADEPDFLINKRSDVYLHLFSVSSSIIRPTFSKFYRHKFKGKSYNFFLSFFSLLILLVHTLL